MSDAARRQRVYDGAVRVLAGNHRTGISQWRDERGQPRSYDYTCPSPRSYPFQWFWDSCFHAIALTHVNHDRAKAELRSLLTGAQPDGFLPHILFWEREQYLDVMQGQTLRLGGPYWSSSIQPPVVALAVERVYRATNDEQFLADVLPRTAAFFDWLNTHRAPDPDGLIVIVQPDESGVDASPKYDPLLAFPQNNDELVVAINSIYARYAALPAPNERAVIDVDVFVVKDVLVNSIYAQGLQSLARLCPEPQAAVYRGRAERVLRSLEERCYDAERGLFFDLLGRKEQRTTVNTISAVFPLIVEGLDTGIARKLMDHLEQPNEYALPYPVPSVARNEPTFDPDHPRGFIWRGPTWVNTNWFLARALHARGEVALAQRIGESTRALIDTAGYRECYNPLTGEGQQSRDFSWSTLVIDMHDSDAEPADC